MIPLSEATVKRIRSLFPQEHRVEVANVLAMECGDNLRLPLIDRGPLLERVRFSVLKLSDGQMDQLRSSVALAQTDWRRVIRDAGFDVSRTAHEEWYP